MNTTDKVRENRLRRMAERQGLSLVKCRRRDPRAVGFGRYALVKQNTTVDADTSYDQTLDDVEEYLTKPSRKAVTSC